jgi:hypothetical protein
MGTIATVGAIAGMVFLVWLGVACLIIGLTLIVGSLIEKYTRKNDGGSLTEIVAENQDETVAVTI